jgi:hypothetical protein
MWLVYVISLSPRYYWEMSTELFQLAGNIISISHLVVHSVFINEALTLVKMSQTFPVISLTSFYPKQRVHIIFCMHMMPRKIRRARIKWAHQGEQSKRATVLG